MKPIFALAFRGISSVGSEHLPYKQRVGGSTPSSPTKCIKELENSDSFFILSRDETKLKQILRLLRKIIIFATKVKMSTKTKSLKISFL